MGNCINRQQVVSWADDDEDWDLMENEAASHGRASNGWKKNKEDEEASTSSSSSASSVVVKMRMTKRQLNELLRLANKKGAVDVKRVLAHVMNTGTVVVRHEGGRGAQWAPRLESIPEASEDELLL